MLFPIVHLPRLYSEAPTDPKSADLYYSLLTNILWDARENCLLLVDQGDSVGAEIRALVDRWPIKYRIRAQTQLKKLKKEGRFVEVPGAHPVEPGCVRRGCERALSIASQEHPSIVVGSSDCGTCTHVDRNGVEVTNPGGYVVSEFAGRRRNPSVVLAEREWTQADFEREVWHPIFRHAKHVKIFDRNIGRYGVCWNPQDGSAMMVSYDYGRTLEWIFERFVKMSSGRADRVFEVTCGLRSASGNRSAIEAAATLRRFAGTLTQRYGFPLTMTVKMESSKAHLRHDRFIITDQIALMVGRGFDLLTEDDRIRDTVITYVSNRGDIEREARDLEPAP